MSKYSKEFKEEALKLSDEIGVVPSQQKWTQKSFKKRNES